MAHKKMTYEELKQRLQDRSLSLSFSSGKEFGNSPNEFIKYFTEDRHATPDMLLGSAVHGLVLESEEALRKQYAIFEKPVPDKDLRNSDNKAAWEEFKANLNGKEHLTEEILAEAKKISEAIKVDPLAQEYLRRITTTEMRFETEINGWKVTGYRDAVGDQLLCDLKKVPDAHPLSAERHIGSRHWDAQSYLYGGGGNVDTIIICYDKSCGVSVMQLSDEWIENGKAKIEKWLLNLDMWILSGCPRQSHSFWYPQPHKPALRTWHMVTEG